MLISAVFMSEYVVELLAKSGGLNGGYTYEAHAVCSAASLAVQKILARGAVLANVHIMGIYCSVCSVSVWAATYMLAIVK